MPERRPSRPASPLLVIAAVALACAILGGIGVGILAASVIVTRPAPAASAPVAVDWPAVAPPALERQTAVSPIAPAPPMRLVDQAGKAFDLADLRGSQVLVFFGYTHCPDVCPTTLADVRDALARSPTKFKVVFVTIDPARDDAPSLARYLGYYEAGFIGADGHPRPGPRSRRRMGRAVRPARQRGGGRVCDGPHGGRLPRGRAGAPSPPDLVRGGAGRDRRPGRPAGGGACSRRGARAVRRTGTVRGAGTPTPGAPATLPPATPTPAPSDAAPATPAVSPQRVTGVVPVLQTSVIRAGMNRLVVTTSDSNNRELAWPDATAHLTFRSTADPAASPIEADAYQIWISVGTKGAWVVDAAFPAPGPYAATISLARDGAPIGSATFGFSVRDHGSTPAVGDPAPSIQTPIATDVGGVLARHIDRRLPGSAVLPGVRRPAARRAPAVRADLLLAGILPDDRLRPAAQEHEEDRRTSSRARPSSMSSPTS